MSDPIASRWQLVPVADLKIREDRHRRTFDEARAVELVQSLRDIGLMQLPVVRMVEGEVVLIAGERRIKAMQALWSIEESFNYLGMEIPVGAVPCALIEDVDPLLAEQMELEENIRRVDLPWQERVAAIARLHRLRGQSLQETAEELGYAKSEQVSHAITLAPHLNDPDVQKAGSVKEALKTLNRKFEKQLTAKLAEATDISTSQHSLIKGYAIEELEKLPTASFEVVLTDPPYGVDAESFDANLVVKHEYADDWEAVQTLLAYCAKELWRVTKDQAHLYCFCDVQRFMELRSLFEAVGFDVWPRPLIWVKDKGHIPRPHHGPQRRYECILYALKGDMGVTGLFSDVITIPAVEHPRHAAEKPVALYIDLLRRSIRPGDSVLDPFCGSGTIFEAAHRLQCQATGIDLDIALSTERIGRLL